jgi:thiamine biosynthesis protein ThiI
MSVSRNAGSSREAILIRYHEIALKGENRSWYEERLASSARKLLRRALGKDAGIEITRVQSRLIAHAPWNEVTIQTLSRLFGASSFSVLRMVPTTHDDLKQAAIDEISRHAQLHGMPRSFRVRTRRTEKVLPETSIQLDRLIGSAVTERFSELEVDLKKPELSIGLELHKQSSYLWTQKFPGPGGLPYKTQPPLLALLSGGLDSPIAALRMIRRGAPVQFLHFHGTPFVGEEVIEKVEDLVRVVNRFQPDPQPLHVVPFGKLQETIALRVHPKIRTLLYRRMMLRIASELAKQRKLGALITGEALGQVASQTVENITNIDQAARIPVLRPLIALDKDEIIAQAHQFGTYEISIRPGADCCTLFADRHPALRAQIGQLEDSESKLPIEEMLTQALARVETRYVRG